MKFSVIIPVYNVAPYLRECLDSVVLSAQGLGVSGEGTEVICVDDGSTDGSGAILDEYAERFNKPLKFKVIHQKNQGVSAARNRGLEESNGEWILFLDGDDVWHLEIFRVCDEMIECNKDADLLSFARIRFPEDEQPKWMPITKDYKSRDLSKGVLQEDLRYSFCTFAYRRDIALSTRFPPYVVGEDLLYRARCLNRANCLIKTENVLFAYRTRKSSVSNTHLTYKKYIDRIKYLIQWLCLILTSSRPQPKGFVWRLVKNLMRTIVIFK